MIDHRSRRVLSKGSTTWTSLTVCTTPIVLYATRDDQETNAFKIKGIPSSVRLDYVLRNFYYVFCVSPIFATASPFLSLPLGMVMNAPHIDRLQLGNKSEGDTYFGMIRSSSHLLCLCYRVSAYSTYYFEIYLTAP